MRAIFLILIIGVVALIAAIHFGLVDITQTRSAQAPTVAAGDGKISATGGQTPKFEVETGSVGVGSREQNVTLMSESLDKSIKLRVSTHGLRSVEHVGGLDNWLTKTKADKLSDRAAKLKRELAKKAKATA